MQGQAAPARVLEPRTNDLAVRLDLVQVVAAQTFVAQAGDAFAHDLIGGFERLARSEGLLVGLQGQAVRPPQLRRRHPIERGEVMRAMQFGSAPRGSQRGTRLIQRQRGFPDTGQGTHFVGDESTCTRELLRALEMTQRGRRFAFEQREPTLDDGHGRSNQGVANSFRHSGHFCDVGARTVQMPHRCFHPGQLTEVCGLWGTRTGATVDCIGLEHQPAGTPVEPKMAVRDAQVAGDDSLTFDIARRLEIGECLMQGLQLNDDIGLIEDEHVERIAGAIEVAGLPAQRQCSLGRLNRLLGPTLRAAPHCDHPQRTPFIRGPSQRAKQSGCSHRMAHRLFKVRPGPELRFGEPKQAHRFERHLLTLACGLERGGGGGDGRLEFALAHPHQGLAVARLCLECGSAGAVREVEHRLRIGAGAREIALGDEAFRAQVEQVEPACHAQAGRAQRRSGQLDRLRMRSGPRQVADLPGRRDRRPRASLRGGRDS